MKEFKGAIFDLDGTIIDSMDVWETIDIKFLEKRNITMPNDYIEKINSMSFAIKKIPITTPIPKGIKTPMPAARPAISNWISASTKSLIVFKMVS